MQMNDTGRVADTARATEEVPPAVEEALAAVVAVVVTRYASLSSSCHTCCIKVLLLSPVSCMGMQHASLLVLLRTRAAGHAFGSKCIKPTPGTQHYMSFTLEKKTKRKVYAFQRP